MMQLEVGDKFHSLEIIHYCGGGAYGDVYCCKDISGQRLALKIVSKKRLGEGWQRELHGVINYRKITEKAPELLQIFHVEDNEDYFFYTMEAADSTNDLKYTPDTLADRLKNGPIPDQEVYPMLAQILKGIKIIHDNGFTHRDIKPDNIIFVGGIPKLSDIGLMSSLSATVSMLAGTLDFLPPELRAADSSESTDRQSRKRSDIYAFGKVIYCAVTGLTTRSFPSVPQELTRKMQLRHLLQLAFRLCDKSPEQRIDSIDELQEEFDAIKTKMEQGESKLDEVRYRLSSFFRGSCRRRYWLVIVALLLLLPAMAWWGVKMLQAKNNPAIPYTIISEVSKDADKAQPTPTVPSTPTTAIETSNKTETAKPTDDTADATPSQSDTRIIEPSPKIETVDLKTPEIPEIKKIEIPDFKVEIVEVPYQEYDLAIPQTQVFRHDKLGLTMNVPAQWEIVDTKTYGKYTKDEKKEYDPFPKDYTQDQKNAFLKGAEIVEGFIIADFSQNFADNITISVDNSVEILQSTDSEIRLFIRSKFQGELGFNTEIYAIKRMKVNDIPCVFIDLSHDPKRFRIHNFCFIRGDKVVSIVLTAKLSTMQERVALFAKVISSVKFDTPKQ